MPSGCCDKYNKKKPCQNGPGMLMANGAIAKYGVALIARIVQITNRYPV